MQYEILSFYKSIETSFGLVLANFLSFLGEETMLILIILFVYYIYSKKAGFVIFSSLLCAQTLTNAIKSVVRYPRPFALHPDLMANRIETATGYSFPSGHTTSAASFYPALGKSLKKRAFLIAGIVLAVLIGISRNYLRVHWPMDVLAGMIIGLVFSLALSTLFERIYEDKEKRIRFSMIAGIAGLATGALLALLLAFTGVDKTAYNDFMKTLALLGGTYIGAVLEARKAGFAVCRKPARAAANILLSLLVVILVMQAGKLIEGPASYIFSWVRYAFLGFWFSGLYPLIATRTGLMEKERENS